MPPQYHYQLEKLNLARSCLMLPHSEGEAKSIAYAFQACHLGFSEINEAGLDTDAASWVRKLKEHMNTDGIKDPKGEGTFYIKAKTFSNDQKMEISKLIDELAHWFRRHESNE